MLIIGFAASFIANTAGGGGGLISLPAMIFLGLPPNIAVATNRFGALGAAGAGAYKFMKSKKIVLKYVLPLVVISLLASFIGANILVRINQAVLSKAIGIILLLMLPFVFLRKDSGIKQRKVSTANSIIGFVSYFFMMVYDGLLGIGAGIIAIYILVLLFGMTYLEAIATDRIPWLVGVIVSTIVFAYYGLINYWYGMILLIGMSLGGYIGAHVAIKKGAGFVKIMFSIFVVAASIKLLFF